MHQFQFQTPYAAMLNNNVNNSMANANKQANIDKQELDKAFENAKCNIFIIIYSYRLKNYY